MDARRYPWIIIPLSCVLEYAPLAILASRLNTESGFKITLGCVIAHVFISGKARFHNSWFRVCAWFIAAGVVDASVIAFGLALHFQLFGPALFDEPDTLRQISSVALEMAATVATVRVCTTSAIKILELKTKPTDRTICPRPLLRR